MKYRLCQMMGGPDGVALLGCLWPGRNLLAQMLQVLEGLEQGLILLREVEADQIVHGLAEEGGAGDGADLHLRSKVLAEGKI